MAYRRVEVRVAAPPERVFAAWIDLDRMHEWVGGVTRVTDVTGSPDQVGARYTVWFGRMASRTEVLEADPPHRLRTRFGNQILRGESQATFVADGGGTRLTQEFWTEGIVAAISSWIFARGTWRGSFRGELLDFARLVERGRVR